MDPWVESIDIVVRHDGYAIRSRIWIGDDPNRRLCTAYRNGFKTVESAERDAVALAKPIANIRQIGVEQGNVIRSITIS